MWQAQSLGRLQQLGLPGSPSRRGIVSFLWRSFRHDHLSSKGFCARAADQGLARLENLRLGIKISSREQSTWWRVVLVAEQLRPPSYLTWEAAGYSPQPQLVSLLPFQGQGECRAGQPSYSLPSSQLRGAED